MQPGQALGRYLLEKELPGGGMADVFLARDPNFDRTVVVKVIKREYSGNPDFRVRFNREARVIAGLEHEAIVPVYDFGEHDGQPFIVMRLLTGGSLAGKLADGPLALDAAAAVVARVAAALDVAHNRGVIHRDLKPGNILFDDHGSAFLSDFGIAKTATATLDLTGTAIVGTPAYMSPEQARAIQELDRRSDVYSLGVVVYEMLAGALPYQAMDPVGLLLAHANEPVPSLAARRPGLPAGCDDLIRRAMAKNPDDRYATAGDLARELSALAAGPAPTPPHSSAGSALRRDPVKNTISKSSRGRLALGAAAGLILLLLAAAALTGLPRLFVAPPTATLLPASPTAATPSLPAGATRAAPVDDMAQVFVPAGSFYMGSGEADSQASADERPMHLVDLDSFWMDKTDVTNALYARCVQAGACTAPASASSATRRAYYGSPQYASYPVVNVTWNDAAAYCAWAGRRLPTEAEWEKAARGPSASPAEARLYPWGINAPDASLLNFDHPQGDTTPVGQYPLGASPYGALDMAGNVWQWVNDWYASDYYAASPARNPAGPAASQYRVMRGGSFDFAAVSMRLANRERDVPAHYEVSLGFRCAATP